MKNAFLIGGGKVLEIKGQRGVTPSCEGAIFKRGEVVLIRRNKAVAHFPRELVVLVAVPPLFSPDDAVADLLGEPRPLMKQVGRRGITYVLIEPDKQEMYLCPEKFMLPSGKPALEIGTITKAPANGNL